jgi:hypothetical protein
MNRRTLAGLCGAGVLLLSCGDSDANSGLNGRVVDGTDVVTSIRSSLPTTSVPSGEHPSSSVVGSSIASAGPVSTATTSAVGGGPGTTRVGGPTTSVAESPGTTRFVATSSVVTTSSVGTTSSVATTTSVGVATSVQREQKLTLEGVGNRRLDQSPFDIVVMGRGGPVLAIVGATGSCTADGARVTLLRAGPCDLRADAPAQAGYGAASVSTRFTVTPGETHITTGIADGAVVPYSAAGWDVAARASSGQTVTISVVDQQGCELRDSRIYAGLANGVDCTLTLSSPATSDWTAGAATLSFDITEVYGSWTVTGPDSVASGANFAITVKFTHPASSSDAGIAAWVQPHFNENCEFVTSSYGNRATTITAKATGASGTTCNVDVYGSLDQWYRKAENVVTDTDILIVEP